MKRSRVDKQILNDYNNEERYELKSMLNDEKVNRENIYDEDSEYIDNYEEQDSQKLILAFKTRLKHFQNYTRTTLQFFLIVYIMIVLLILPVLSKLKNSPLKLNRRSSVFAIQGSLIVFIHCKLLLTDTGMPGISNSQRVTERQSRVIHGLTALLIFGLIMKTYLKLCWLVFSTGVIKQKQILNH
ncbi:hypothetical protein HANVADRAFT_2570 [Hanseniaspora valbyensis NRRL Y-1626]|uniref:Uncharacterized protein n=1 Tax=Hanseniaspora valbyensis NRRL Y-1626 TaxID=766949 RepID=A0A1B7TCZ1_9ASCO|nr:hypothetical protein HANVADRAFT_2570 [Hanseniaspora valbyensis NRRL Y-1626]